SAFARLEFLGMDFSAPPNSLPVCRPLRAPLLPAARAESPDDYRRPANGRLGMRHKPWLGVVARKVKTPPLPRQSCAFLYRPARESTRHGRSVRAPLTTVRRVHVAKGGILQAWSFDGAFITARHRRLIHT